MSRERGIAVFFMFCVLLFCGCMSLEDEVQEPSEIPLEPDSVFLFAWDSEVFPIISGFYANCIVPSGFGDIFFGNYGATIREGERLINLSEGRTFLIGPTQESLEPTATGGGSNITTVHRQGQFDLSQGTFRLTIDFETYRPGNSDPWMRILLNNNTGGTGQSVLGAASTLCQITNSASLLAPGSSPGVTCRGGTDRLVLTFTPSVRFASLSVADKDSLKTAFIGIRCNNSLFNITGIRLEKVE